MHGFTCGRVLVGTLLAFAGSGGIATAGCDPDERRAATPPEPNVACPDASADPEIAALIVRVTATGNGVSILLTSAGIDAGRSCDGARRLVRMASDLYRRIPAAERLRDDLLWATPAITREVFAHAWAAELGIDNGNPVDVVFADYTGESTTLQGAIWNGPLGKIFDLLGCDD